jgi:hypothetical protein
MEENIMAYPIVRLDILQASQVGALLRSVEYATKSGSTYTPAQISNGCVALLDGLKTDEREVWHAIAPAANSPLKSIVLVASPEIMTDERKHNLDDYVNEAGVIARGYILQSGDTFAVTSDGFTIANGLTPAVGTIAELQADTKMKLVSSLTSNSTKVGVITAIETSGSKTYYVIEVA